MAADVKLFLKLKWICQNFIIEKMISVYVYHHFPGTHKAESIVYVKQFLNKYYKSKHNILLQYLIFNPLKASVLLKSHNVSCNVIIVTYCLCLWFVFYF